MFYHPRAAVCVKVDIRPLRADDAQVHGSEARHPTPQPHPQAIATGGTGQGRGACGRVGASGRMFVLWRRAGYVPFLPPMISPTQSHPIPFVRCWCSVWGAQPCAGPLSQIDDRRFQHPRPEHPRSHQINTVVIGLAPATARQVAPWQDFHGIACMATDRQVQDDLALASDFIRPCQIHRNRWPAAPDPAIARAALLVQHQIPAVNDGWWQVLHGLDIDATPAVTNRQRRGETTCTSAVCSRRAPTDELPLCKAGPANPAHPSGARRRRDSRRGPVNGDEGVIKRPNSSASVPRPL